jgi:hypothetical protein
MSTDSSHTASSGATAKPPIRRDERALQAILSKSPTLYVNFVGEPMILLPIEGSPEEQAAHRLHSPRVRAYLFATVHRKAEFVPYEDEISRVLRILEDLAWNDVRISVPFGDALEQHALLEAVNLLLHGNDFRNGYDGTASRLRNLLNDLAIEQGIDVRQKDWPRGSARLSQQLWELKDTLHGGGILLERGRTNGARWIKLIRPRSDDGPQTASPPRPPDNVPPSKTFEPNDDGDGVTRDLLDRIDANFEKKE